MSNVRLTILQARAVKDQRITDAQFRTLAALGMYADEDGWCYPLLTTLGKDLGKSKQAVGRDTIALRKLGYLEVRARFEKNGARRSSLYRLRFDLPPVNVDDSTPSTPEVDTPSTPEVDVNVPVNAPILTEKDAELLKNAGLDWMILAGKTITPEFLEKLRTKEVAPIKFEEAFKTGKWPWDSNTVWTDFRKFIVKIYAEDQSVFLDYVAWRNGDGKYKAFSNRKIRENPQMFIDTGYPEFVASKAYQKLTESASPAEPKPLETPFTKNLETWKYYERPSFDDIKAAKKSSSEPLT